MYSPSMVIMVLLLCGFRLAAIGSIYVGIDHMLLVYFFYIFAKPCKFDGRTTKSLIMVGTFSFFAIKLILLEREMSWSPTFDICRTIADRVSFCSFLLILQDKTRIVKGQRNRDGKFWSLKSSRKEKCLCNGHDVVSWGTHSGKSIHVGQIKISMSRRDMVCNCM